MSRLSKKPAQSSAALLSAGVMVVMLVLVLLFIRYYADKAASALLYFAEGQGEVATEQANNEPELTGSQPIEREAQRHLQKALRQAQDAVLKSFVESGN